MIAGEETPSPTEPLRINVRHTDGDVAAYDVLELNIYGEFVVRIEHGAAVISALHQDEQ